MADLDLKHIQPDGLVNPATPYTQIVVIESGKLAFIAGQLSTNENGQTIGVGDIQAQLVQIVHNMKCALDGLGATFQNIVKMTTFMVNATDLDGFMTKRQEIFPELFPDGKYPANTLVIVEQLPNPDWLIEVEACVAIP